VVESNVVLGWACSCKCRIMGRKAGTLYINPKKFGALHKPCMKEMITFLNCLAQNHSSAEKCVRQKELLSACMDTQVTQLFKFIVTSASFNVCLSFLAYICTCF
jgi:hypothetical protein